MSSRRVSSPPGALAAATALGPVTLRVAEASRAARFYEETLGLRQAGMIDGLLALRAGEEPLVLLKQVPGAFPSGRASGLFHFAILLPSRAALGGALRRLVRARVGIGAADHLVSEAIYLSDPDGNGIEIYRDRPRAEWRWNNGAVEMATDPLDLDALLDEGEADTSGGMPAGTRMGHIHLQVGDVPPAMRFYRDLVGFTLTASWQGAAFLSAGGYHHHLGLNSWASRGAPPASEGSAGLQSFVIRVPSAEEQAFAGERLAAGGVKAVVENGVLRVRDPWNVGIDIEISEGGKA